MHILLYKAQNPQAQLVEMTYLYHSRNVPAYAIQHVSQTACGNSSSRNRHQHKSADARYQWIQCFLLYVPPNASRLSCICRGSLQCNV